MRIKTASEKKKLDKREKRMKFAHNHLMNIYKSKIIELKEELKYTKKLNKKR